MRDKPQISVDPSGSITVFHERGDKTRISLDEIRGIVMFKRDLWTVDLVCAEISYEQDGQPFFIEVHEEIPGFDAMLALFERLPGFDRDWRSKVIPVAFKPNETVVFSRQA